YIVEFRATTPNGNIDIVTKRIKVHTLKVSAYLMPNPAMAGDQIWFFVKTEGYAEQIEIVVDQDIVNKDNRSSMGYSSVKYPLVFQVDGSLNVKEDILKYIV
ncbi:hypothetical protein, partial [Stenotrophomonas maltophilia group sp. RNC7]|uniref:hypothetical protein n=1 Tax=Stenotrophomonas maltophilia group sp. RNC7 TaxID=3071467 RepID=UPI0027E1B0BB